MGGRTLFLVGDPMQSIYRFREAEVGLFLDAHEQGIGGLPLEFLRLTTNFRSDPGIVDWFNKVFAKTLPEREDRLVGAVPFSPSIAFHDAAPHAGVWWHVVPHGDRQREAEEIGSIIEKSRDDQPEESIGILVRSRQHATIIAKHLRTAGIDFTGTDFEKLEERGVVQDLLALTFALTHPGDRLAWLAVLRGPWCGLTLCDLHAVAGADRASLYLGSGEESTFAQEAQSGWSNAPGQNTGTDHGRFVAAGEAGFARLCRRGLVDARWSGDGQGRCRSRGGNKIF